VRFSLLPTFNPADLTLSVEIERAASLPQPDTLHLAPLPMRPNETPSNGFLRCTMRVIA
jgi:hypothetical protein